MMKNMAEKVTGHLLDRDSLCFIEEKGNIQDFSKW